MRHSIACRSCPDPEARCIVTDGKGTAVYIGESLTWRCVRINIELKGASARSDGLTTSTSLMDQGIGARLLRKEDDRYIRGPGQFVGDIKVPGMQEVAFLRSPIALAA